LTDNHESLARVLIETRVADAARRRPGHLLDRAQRLGRKAERSARRARLARARIM